MRTIIELFRITSIEPIRMPIREGRLALLAGSTLESLCVALRGRHERFADRLWLERQEHAVCRFVSATLSGRPR